MTRSLPRITLAAGWIAAIFLVLALSDVGTTSPARAAQESAQAFVGRVLQTLSKGPSLSPDQLYTPTLARLVKSSGTVAARRHEVGCLEGDPVLDCQECSPLKGVSLSTTDQGPQKVTVVARFNVAGYDREMRYDLAMTPAGWRIDDVHSSDTPSLRAFLATKECR